MARKRRSKKKVGVYWAVLHERHEHYLTVDMREDLVRHNTRLGYQQLRHPYSRVDEARNKLSRKFCDLTDDPDAVLVMMDQDHAHVPNTVQRLAAANKPVVGALAFRRGEPYDPQVYIRDAAGELLRPVEWEDGFLQCTVIGMAAIAIKRAVFYELDKAGFRYPWFRNIYVDGQDPNLAEDWDFCLKCERLGIGVFADMGLVAPHMDIHYIDEKPWLEAMKGTGKPINDALKDTAWERLHNQHKGETCLIIGNGPSLSDVPNKLFEKYPTFGSNRVYKKLAPTYFVSVNPLVLEQFGEEAVKTVRGKTKRCFLSASWLSGRRDIGMQPFVTPIKSIGPGFSENPAKGIYEGHTVTFVSMQLAYWMGFKRVLLVGVDHSYDFEGEPNAAAVMDGPDPNHFADDYFPEGTRWHNPDLKKSEEAYRMARETFDADGREIINLGPRSELDVFERDEIEAYL